jgi:hypothetical protein
MVIDKSSDPVAEYELDPVKLGFDNINGTDGTVHAGKFINLNTSDRLIFSISRTDSMFYRNVRLEVDVALNLEFTFLMNLIGSDTVYSINATDSVKEWLVLEEHFIVSDSAVYNSDSNNSINSTDLFMKVPVISGDEWQQSLRILDQIFPEEHDSFSVVCTVRVLGITDVTLPPPANRSYENVLKIQRVWNSMQTVTFGDSLTYDADVITTGKISEYYLEDTGLMAKTILIDACADAALMIKERIKRQIIIYR